MERKKRAEDIAGYMRILLADPKNPLRHDQVAMLLLSSGQLEQAIGHMRDSLRLDPSSAPTHYNLGLALSCSGSSRGAHPVPGSHPAGPRAR